MADDTDQVVFNQEEGLPYSKGLMAQALMATGVSPERAYAVAAAVERMLKESGTQTVTLAGLREAACVTLGTTEGESLIARFVQRERLSRFERRWSSSSAAPRAWARAPWPRSWRTGWASPASSAPTPSAR